MNFNLSYIEEWSTVLKISLAISICFLIFTILLIVKLFFLRLKKVRLAKRNANLVSILLDFITSYLFAEDFDFKTETIRLKNNHLSKGHDKKTAIQQILIFDKNLKGESTAALKELFFALDLDSFVRSQLYSKKWSNKARSLYVLSELSIKVPTRIIVGLINDKRNEVRQQAGLYLLKLSVNKPLFFLNKIDRPLTLWQQIHIENSLKNDYNGDIPDFSEWLDHKYTSVVEFAIRMMAEFNQFYNIPNLTKFLESEVEPTRIEAMRCLCKMGYSDMIPNLLLNFKNESIKIQYEILDIVQRIGTYEQFTSLASEIVKIDNSIKVRYFNLNRLFNIDLEQNKIEKLWDADVITSI